MRKQIHNPRETHTHVMFDHIKGYAHQFDEKTQVEWQHLREGVEHDTYDLAEHWADTSEELKTWWFIDKNLIRAQLFKVMVSAADQTRTDLWYLDHERELLGMH